MQCLPCCRNLRCHVSGAHERHAISLDSHLKLSRIGGFQLRVETPKPRAPGPASKPPVTGSSHFVSGLCQLQVVPGFRYSTLSLIDDFPDVVVPDK